MKHIKLEMPSSYKIAHLGDIHKYVTGYPHKTVRRAIQKIKSEKNYFVGYGGDIFDSMSPQDKRYVHGQYEGNMARLQDQVVAGLEEHEPIADRTLWGISGNHELRMINTWDATKSFLEGLGCNIYGPKENSAYLLKADLGDIRLLDWHGSGFISSNANDDYIMIENEKRSVKKKLRKLPGDDCEVLIMHHIHKIRIIPPTDRETLKLVSDGNKLKAFYPKPVRKYYDKENYYYDINDRWYASSGAFLPTYAEGFSGYGEVKGYRPSEMGWCYTEVKNGRLVGVMEETF